MLEDLLQVRAFAINFYVLRDPKGLYVVDGGFLGGPRLLRKALKAKGWGSEPIRGILVTHGHLDHILHVGKLAQLTGAWIAAPRLDAAHYAGNPQYPGLAKVTGWLEAIGRPLLRFKPFAPTRLLDHGDFLDLWDGLKVIHLPGHTPGHSGFYCERRQLLLSGDLFASYGWCPRLPPAIFNHDGAEIPKSVSKALALDLKGVLPNHADRSSPEVHLDRLRVLGGDGRGRARGK